MVGMVARASSLALLVTIAVGGCLLETDYSGTEYRCSQPPYACPAGFRCMAGICRSDGWPLDAATSSTDATIDGAMTTDAAAMAADAGLCASIVVDGDLAEALWEGNWHSLTKVVVGADNGVSVEFTARWSAAHLLAAYRVTDAALVNDSTYIWQDDAVELYLDIDYDRDTVYGADDFQFIAGWGDDTVWEIAGRNTGVLYAYQDTATGYTAELAVPWETVGASPALDNIHGFDAAYDLDQDGDVGDGQLMWSGTAENYNDTSSFGSVTLTDSCAVTLVPFSG